MVTLITCVFVGKDTAVGYFTDIAETSYGKWHIALYDIDSEQYASVRELPYIESTGITENLQYSLLPESGNATTPYLNIRGYSSEAFDYMNITVTEGRLPEAEDEIIISKAAADDGASIEVGDEIEVGCFRRYIVNNGSGTGVFPFQEFVLESGETKEAPADFPYYTEDSEFYDEYDEVHESTGYSATFTVVGFCEAPSYEEDAAYTAITLITDVPESGAFNCLAVTDPDVMPYNVEDDISERTGTDEVELNDAVMIFWGNSSDNTLNAIIIAAQVFFTVLILAVSVIMIFNLFNLSYEERCRYLGMLSSTGATGRQKRSSVYFEALVLLGAAVPVGFVLALILIVPVVYMVMPLAAGVIGVSGNVSLSVQPVIKLTSVLLVLAVSVVTVLVSAWLPARKIGKIGPIEAVRGNLESGKKREFFRGRRNSHRMEEAGRKHVKPTTAAELMLASHFARKGKSTAIVRALAVFLVVLVVTTYGMTALSQMLSYKVNDNLTYVINKPAGVTYSLTCDTYDGAVMEALAEELRSTDGITDVSEVTICMWGGMTDSEIMSDEYWDDMYSVISMYYPDGLSLSEFENTYRYDHVTPVNMIAVDTEMYELLGTVAEDAQTSDCADGSVMGSLVDDSAASSSSENQAADNTAEDGNATKTHCIVVNYGEMSTDSQMVWENELTGYKFYEIGEMTRFAAGDTFEVDMSYESSPMDRVTMVVDTFASADDIPVTYHSDELWVVVTAESLAEMIPYAETLRIDTNVFFNADASDEAAAKILDKLGDINGFTLSTSDTMSGEFGETEIAQISKMLKLLMAAFVVITAVLCYLNLYNSVSGLMNSRSRTFAMLKSQGMTLRQLLRTEIYEFVIIVLRAVLTAVPVTVLLCAAVYMVMVKRFGEFTVNFPVVPIAVTAALAVIMTLLIAVVCTRSAAGRDMMEEIRSV